MKKIVLVLFLLTSPLFAGISGDNVPSVLTDKIERLSLRLSIYISDFTNEYKTKQDTFTEGEWATIALHVQYANSIGGAAKVANAICESESKGFYCDAAASQLKVVEEEFEILKKYHERVKSNVSKN